MHVPARFLTVVAACMFAAQAYATGAVESIITDPDRQRLNNYDVVRAEALSEARSAGSPADIATLEKIIAGKPKSFANFDMTGEWKCRTVKAGGMAGLVVYGWFACRVTDDGSGWFLEKLTGSQRTDGSFFTDSDKRLIFLGSFYVAGENPPRYGSGPQSDRAGYAYLIGNKHWRIEFPAPTFESKLDILELRR